MNTHKKMIESKFGWMIRWGRFYYFLSHTQVVICRFLKASLKPLNTTRIFRTVDRKLPINVLERVKEIVKNSEAVCAHIEIGANIAAKKTL